MADFWIFQIVPGPSILFDIEFQFQSGAVGRGHLSIFVDPYFCSML